MNQITNKEYSEHKVFLQLSLYVEFYKDLSEHIMGWKTQGTGAILNLDTYVYTSIKGTLESIKDILIKGRINDAYALLRKYFDSTIINVYSNLFLDDHFSIENFIVSQIDNWVKGKDKIPEYRIMSQYIKQSPKLEPITILLLKDKTYKHIRDRCNNHTHYNFYHNLLLNDNEVYLKNRIATLSEFLNDLDAIFIQHIGYTFYLNEHYMMASDYVDSLEMGITPEEGSETYVAPFIQDVFDEVINIKRIDIANEIRSKTSIQLK